MSQVNDRLKALGRALRDRNPFAGSKSTGNGKPLVCQWILMPQENDKRKGEASSKEKAVCACTAVLARLTAWILEGGPTLGIAFALIWGIQAAACAASSKGDHSGSAG
jgi:hypothetical protein